MLTFSAHIPWQLDTTLIVLLKASRQGSGLDSRRVSGIAAVVGLWPCNVACICGPPPSCILTSVPRSPDKFCGLLASATPGSSTLCRMSELGQFQARAWNRGGGGSGLVSAPPPYDAKTDSKIYLPLQHRGAVPCARCVTWGTPRSPGAAGCWRSSRTPAGRTPTSSGGRGRSAP